MNKFIGIIDMIIALVCWFILCFIMARWVCVNFNVVWSWHAFIVVWIILSVAVILYIAKSK